MNTRWSCRYRLFNSFGKNGTQGINRVSGVGVSIGGGTSGYGIGVFANVNAAKGHEKGNGTAWTETTLDSGGTVSMTSGRDAILDGAQVSGNAIVADIGRDLLMRSQQDSNDYKSKQNSVAAGGSFSFGSMTGSGYVSASQDKMNSTFDSVQEQTGLYAGDGGFDITVGRHTQLDGAVIASTAQADKNRLDTGTLGFSDIHNEADYKVSHSGVSMSGGGSFGKDTFTGNMPGGMVSAGGSSGHAEGTTQAAVANGTITVRDTANQQQDVADLSRDTEHANDSISPIFDKEKEQKRLQAVSLISEIGSQAMDIARTQGELAGRAAAKDPQALEEARQQLITEGEPVTDKAVADRAYGNAMAQYGTGSTLQRGIQAATAALSGLAGGNMAGALAGASAPELAHMLKATEGNTAVNTIAHAILGGAVAAIQGNSAAAGAAGAASGELAAKAIAGMLYPDVTDLSKLSEEQKQTVSALATISAGMAGGLAGDSTSSAATGAGAGKNAAENNSLSKEDEKRLGLRTMEPFDINPLFNRTAKVLDGDGDPLKGAGSKSVKPGIPAAKLPSGYAANSTGNIIGPRGSIYNNTGKTDTAGNVIYSNNGGYFIFTEGGKSSVSSPNPSNQIRQNYEQGKLFEDKVYQEHSADKSVSAREITVKTASGVNVRIDIISKDKQGNITCIECKSSPTAPLTPNQKIGFPEVENSGATITGVGKPGFEGGALIPPTKIDIIRPDKKTKG